MRAVQQRTAGDGSSSSGGSARHSAGRSPRWRPFVRLKELKPWAQARLVPLLRQRQVHQATPRRGPRAVPRDRGTARHAAMGRHARCGNGPGLPSVDHAAPDDAMEGRHRNSRQTAVRAIKAVGRPDARERSHRRGQLDRPRSCAERRSIPCWRTISWLRSIASHLRQDQLFPVCGRARTERLYVIGLDPYSCRRPPMTSPRVVTEMWRVKDA